MDVFGGDDARLGVGGGVEVRGKGFFLLLFLGGHFEVI